MNAQAVSKPVNPFGEPLGDRYTVAELMQQPPMARMAIDPFAPTYVVTGLTGAGGVGKGQFLAKTAVAKVLGQDFLGTPQEPGRVIIWTAEDRREDVLRAIHALVVQLSEFQRECLADGLIVKSTVGEGLKLTRRTNGDAHIAPEVTAFIEYAKQVPGVALVIIDTLSRVNGLEETNEGMSLNVEAGERIAVALEAGVVLTHHTGKAVMRAGVADQYTGRGGSSLADNARSMLHLGWVSADDNDAPTNAIDVIREGRLLRLSHTKANRTARHLDIFLERVLGPSGPWLREFRPEWNAAAATASAWAKLASWLRSGELNHPTAADVDNLPAREYGSRSERRKAVAWALDQGLLEEAAHPNPKGRRKTYLRLLDVAEEPLL